MSAIVLTEGVAASTDALRRMLTNPWSYFPNLVGGSLVGLGQIGPNRFLAPSARPGALEPPMRLIRPCSPPP